MWLQVRLLKDILEAWKKEVEKKPSTMTIEDAYESLNLKTGVGGQVEHLVTPRHCNSMSDILNYNGY